MRLSRFGLSEKTLQIDRFHGFDVGKMQAGQLTDAENVRILAGGALGSIPEAVPLPTADSAPLGGVYTLCAEYDADYETPVTPAWVYAHIAPASVLAYAGNLESTARLLVADVGMGGKVNGRYRRALGAYTDGESICVLYEAIYNLIDQRRSSEYIGYNNGTVVQFDADDAENGYYTALGTLTQLWLDRIRGDRVESKLLDAAFIERKRLSSAYARSTLVRKDGGAFHYVTIDNLPQIGGVYTGRPDKVYAEVYPTLAEYAAVGALSADTRRAVAYYNRVPADGEAGAVGAHRLLLPDMRLLADDGLSETVNMPRMTAAVQHFDRLFGIGGSHLYASAAGNCTDFTEAVDDLPATAAWQTVTPDGGGFTAIASFDGKVVVFTESAMLTVRGNALPFSLSYEGAWGCPRAEAVTSLGDWLYFVSGGDVLRYNGSRVESIGGTLPRDLDLAHACLGKSGGTVCLGAYGFDGTLLFDPQSGCWTARRSDVPDVFLGDGMMLSNGVPWRTEDTCGAFAAAVTLGTGARRRITALTLSARFAAGSSLAVYSAAGRLLWHHDSAEGEIVTVTLPVSALRIEEEPLALSGYGDVILYALSARYAQIRS